MSLEFVTHEGTKCSLIFKYLKLRFHSTAEVNVYGPSHVLKMLKINKLVKK